MCCPDRNRPECDCVLCVFVHASPFFCSICLLPLINLPLVLCSTCCAKMSAIWTGYSFWMLHSRLFAHSEICPCCTPVAMISESNGRRSQSGRQLVLIGLVLVRAKGKMTFPCCLFWEGNRKNAGAAVLFLLADPTPVNSSLPLRHSPYSRRGFGCIQGLYSVNNTSSESFKLLWQ